MGEIDPATERDEVGARRLALGRVGGSDEVCRRRRCRGVDVTWRMVLKPVALIDCVVANVGIMEGVKFDEEAPVLEARW